MGMDAIVQHLDRLDNQKDGLEEDIAGILDDQSEAKRDMLELRAEQDRYQEKLEMALQKQQRVVDSLLHLVEDMSGRLKRLEELQPLASGPELPARPATAELCKTQAPKRLPCMFSISRPQSLVSASTQNFQTSHFDSPAVPF